VVGNGRCQLGNGRCQIQDRHSELPGGLPWDLLLSLLKSQGAIDHFTRGFHQPADQFSDSTQFFGSPPAFGFQSPDSQPWDVRQDETEPGGWLTELSAFHIAQARLPTDLFSDAITPSLAATT
jgi:hypothetical protein